MDAIKVLLIINSYEIGGAEHQALILARELAKDPRYKVMVMSLDPNGEGKDILDEIGISHKYFSISIDLVKHKFILRLIRFIFSIREFSPKVIIPYTYQPNVLVGLIWKYTGAKLSVWNQRDIGVHYSDGKLCRIALSNIPLFIANSVGGIEFISSKYPRAKNKCLIIPNGVEVPGYRNGIVKFPFKDYDFKVLMIGNIHKNKDYLTLIKAWKVFLDKLKNVDLKPVLLIAGRKDDPQQVEDEIKKLGLEQSVCFLGQVPNISHLIKNVDVGILSSKNEGCPNVLLEYIVDMLPSIVTRNSGTEEILGANYPLFFDYQDFKQLANHMYNVYYKRIDIQRLLYSNKNIIYQKYSVSKMVNQYKTIINQLR